MAEWPGAGNAKINVFLMKIFLEIYCTVNVTKKVTLKMLSSVNILLCILI